MKLLAIETSSEVGSVAVLESEGRADSIDFPEGTRHGKALVPSIDLLLERAGWKPGDLDVVAVSIGPGSFTGLRVGLVCAKIVASFAGTDLVAVPSLDILAGNAEGNAEHVCAVIDARRGDVYTAVYERQGSFLRRRSGYALATPEEVAKTLREGSYVVGDGVPVVEPAIDGSRVRLAPKERWIPKASVAAEIGARLYEQGQRDDPYLAEPLYLRKTAAEEKWEEREAARG